MPDIRDLLLAAFEVEYREHVDAMRDALERVRKGERIDLREAFRRAHSLKGAARAVDVRAIEEAAHAIETEFAKVLETGGALDAAAAERAGRELDAIERSAQALYRRADAETASEDAGAAGAGMMRIDAQAVHEASQSLNRLAVHVDLLHGGAEALRAIEAQAETLARRMENGEADPREARQLMRAAAAAGRQQRETARASLGATERLREAVDRLSLAPASSVFAGLDVMLRDIAVEAGRDVDVTIEGLETQADRALLQALRDPVMHLLRNAVAHGIEPPMERLAKGKPGRGEIGLSVRARAGRLELRVFDDGRGPDLEKIEAAAVARGLLPQRSPDEPAPAPGQVLALAFESGLSTADAVDRVAGRGVGLSVVAETARRLGGGAAMARRLPAGAEVIVSTPLSAGVQPVLLVEAGGHVFGLPTYAVEQVVRRRPEELGAVDGRSMIKFQSGGNQVQAPVVQLTRLVRLEGAEPVRGSLRTDNPLRTGDAGAGQTRMGQTKAREAGQATGVSGGAEGTASLQVAVLRQGEQRLGVIVDALRQVRAEAVMSLTHPDLDDVVQGAVVIDRGEAALILNPDALLRRHAGLRSGAGAPVAAAKAKVRRTILVVDDSVTTRTLEKGILELNGYEVVLAVDGVEALERLNGRRVDLIVADVEMPRMDGFQLLDALKRDPALSAIPVIMMTSRADPEDVRRGMDLGADAYLVKQAFDQRELLDVVGQLL